MNYQRFEDTIKSDEGFSEVPYLDTVGVATIGYGSTHYLPDDPVTLQDAPLTEENATQLMRADLYTAMKDAHDLFANFGSMNDVRQEVVCNMAYNLGWNRLSGFKKMIAACNVLDYDTAADEMIDSKWYDQVGQRSERLTDEMRKGDL